MAQNELELDGTNFDVAPLPVNRVRICDGVPRRHGVRIRSGKRRRMPMGATPADLKTHRQEELENIWIEQDAEPEIPNFTGNAGIKVQLPENPNIFDIFRLFVTEELYDILVEQTHMYAAQYIDSHPELGEFSLAKDWKPTTRNDMKKFIGLNLLMGLIQKPAIRLY